MPGCVYFVGAGPGDPELLTVRAARVLASADVVLHDGLVGPGILACLPPRAERVPVGRGDVPLPSRVDLIGRRLVAEARRGRAVVRLKGGDPVLFGRLAEEIAYVRAHGVAPVVVPGVNAASAAAAALGVSLTDRRLASGVRLLTGRRAKGAADHPHEEPWRHTHVFFMAVERLPEIAAELLARGFPPGTPAAVVEQVSWPSERVTQAPLADIAALARERRVRSPAVVLVGEVLAARRATEGLGPGPGREVGLEEVAACARWVATTPWL